jgi:hypothetical protein
LFSSEATPHHVLPAGVMSADSPRTSTFTTATLDVHPAGMDASLLNSGDAPPTTNGDDTTSKIFFPISYYIILLFMGSSLISLPHECGMHLFSLFRSRRNMNPQILPSISADRINFSYYIALSL